MSRSQPSDVYHRQAQYSFEINGIRPAVRPDGRVIRLKNARHPLIDLSLIHIYSSSYASSLRGLAVGDTVKITATETVSGAKTVMENCSSAFVTYGYHIVSNGQNVTSTNGLGESFNTARAQRSAIGVKADGTIVLVASSGRTCLLYTSRCV